MLLREHLKATRERVPDFADRIGEKRNTIRKIVYQQRQPSLDLAVRITEATGGAVTGADMVLPATAPDCELRGGLTQSAGAHDVVADLHSAGVSVEGASDHV